MTAASETPTTGTVDMKFEVVVIPVSDVDRAKEFYGASAGGSMPTSPRRRLPRDPVHAARLGLLDHLRQECHRGSARLAQGLYLIVSDVEAARRSFSVAASRSARCSTRPRCVRRPGRALFVRAAGRRPDPEHRSYRSFASFKIRTAMAGCSRRSPRLARPRGRGDTTSPSADLAATSAGRRPPMASTRSGPAHTTRPGQTGTPSTSSESRPAASCRRRRPGAVQGAVTGEGKYWPMVQAACLRCIAASARRWCRLSRGPGSGARGAGSCGSWSRPGAAASHARLAGLGFERARR